MTHPTRGLDDLVHQRVRLGVLSILSQAKSVDFVFLKQELDLTSGNLSRHLTVLVEAGLVSIRKTADGNRSRTWVTITTRGRAALAEELRALRALVESLSNNIDGSHSRR